MVKLTSTAAAAIVTMLALAQANPASLSGKFQPDERSQRGCSFAGQRGGGSFSFIFGRPTAAVADDGRGPYTHDVDGVRASTVNTGVQLYPYTPSGRAPQRSLKVDLRRPVSPQTQTNFGVIDRPDSNFRVHWKQDDAAKVITGILEMPIGATVESQRVEASVMLEGRQHVLRFGSLDVGVCWNVAPVAGQGTTNAVVTRKSETEWVVDLPRGSIGRLWDLNANPTDTTTLFNLPTAPAPAASSRVATDRGLYYADVNVVIRRM